VSNKRNTVLAQSGPLYASGISLRQPESLTQTASRSLQPFLQGSLCDTPTDRPTYHATRSVTIGGAHNGEAKSVIVYGYNEYLLEQSTRQIEETLCGRTDGRTFETHFIRSPHKSRPKNRDAA